MRRYIPPRYVPAQVQPYAYAPGALVGGTWLPGRFVPGGIMGGYVVEGHFEGETPGLKGMDGSALLQDTMPGLRRWGPPGDQAGLGLLRVMAPPGAADGTVLSAADLTGTVGDMVMDEVIRFAGEAFMDAYLPPELNDAISTGLWLVRVIRFLNGDVMQLFVIV